MRKRKLGPTHYEVGEVGFGARGLAGEPHSVSIQPGRSPQRERIDPRDVQRVLYQALESGVSVVDPAPTRGDGTDEKLIGEVIRDLRARDWAVVATKVPPLKPDRALAESELSEVFPPGNVTLSVEQSLRNLRAETLSVAHLHSWHDSWLASSAWPDLRGTMSRLVKEGKVLHWGISLDSRDPSSALAALDEPIIESVGVFYNLSERRCEKSLFAKARETGVAIIARSPFDRGALTEAAEQTEALAELCGDEVADLPELALRFCLSHSDVSVVVPTMRRPEHLQANLAAAAQGPLSGTMLDRLRDVAGG